MTVPRRLAILCAVSQELIPVARQLGLRRVRLEGLARYPTYAGHGADRTIVALACGMGARCAAAAAGLLIEAYGPDLLLIIGVAGALSPELRVGDVVVADAVVTGAEMLTPTLWIDPATKLGPGGAGETAEAPWIYHGALLSVDRVLVTPEEKRAAWEAEPRPLAIEMETAAAARVATSLGVTWTAVRAVSDTAAEGLPLDFNQLRSLDGGLASSRVALAALRRPGSIPGLLRLGRNSSLAAERLADYLASWLQALD